MSLRTSWLPLALLGFAAPAPAVTIDWVAVGNPGNAPDAAVNCGGAAGCGSVPYTFEISRTEVTNAQYAEFLNAVAASDPNGLYDPAMGSGGRGGITRSGSDGSYSYAIRPGAGDKPVVFVSFPDAMRFANWLDNGQPSGAQGPATTEDGSYAITPGGLAANSITRKPGTGVVVPNENEWYKAAYYSPGGVYFDFPTGSDAAPSSDPPPGGAGSANFYDLTGGYAVTGSTQFVDSFDYLTDAGAYASASSPYGTFDQGGNALEWTETIVDGGGFRRARGGSWSFPVTNLAASAGTLAEDPDSAHDELGFRVALSVPEPGSTIAALAALLTLGAGAAARRRRRAP